MHARRTWQPGARLALALSVLVGGCIRAQQPRTDSAGVAQLPADLVAALHTQGCRVPASPAVSKSDVAGPIPQVAYRAPLLGADTEDWAVVCERAAYREALVFSTPVSARSQPTARLPLTWDPDHAGCEGWIAIADSASVRAALTHWRPAPEEALTTAETSMPLHAGIIDSLCEGDGTNLRYWTGRRWLVLPASRDSS